jgi:1,4-dihydroxy-2-naphthoate octaprenyltransferase
MGIDWRRIRLFIRLSRLHLLVGGILLYGLGASLARYLGYTIHTGRLWGGLWLVALLQLAAQYLTEHFNPTIEGDNPGRTLFSGGSGALGIGGLPRRVALYSAIVCLAGAASLASLLLVNGEVPLLGWILLAMGCVAIFLYCVPPVSLAISGYGEVVASVVIAGIIPAFGFALQSGDMHRLLVMTTTPLILLHFAMLMAFSMPTYGLDQKLRRGTLAVRMGWLMAMRLHDLTILLAIASIAAGGFFGIPIRATLGTIIALPLALAQIWQMWRIRNGHPPRWPILTAGAAGLFALVTYLFLAGYLLS